MLRHTGLLGWVCGLLVACWVLATSTPAVVRGLTSAGATPDAVVAGAAAVAAWLLLGWLALAVAVSLAEAVGVPLTCRAGSLAPRAVRLAVRTSVGVGLVAGSLTGGTTAHADEPAGHRWPSLDRPAPAPEPGLAPAAPATSAPEGPAPATRTSYRVRPGDSLWSIAEQHLPPGADAADVAREWPRWWRANRATIGHDPGLIRPGQVLRAPADAP